MKIRPTACVLAVLAAVTCLSAAAQAEDVVGAPKVYFHIERIRAGGNPHQLGVADLARGTLTVKYDDLDWGLDTAIHPGSGRFALSLRVVSDERTYQLDGKQIAVGSVVPVTLAVGSLDKGIEQLIPGDPKCVPDKCFEKAFAFSLDGTRLYTLQLHQMSSKVRSYPLAAPENAALIFDRRKVLATPPGMTPDQTRWAYEGKGGAHVEAMPTFSADVKKKPKLAPASKPKASPKLMMGGTVAVLENTVILFRREPSEQKEGYFELHDLKTRKARRVYTLEQDFPLYMGGFLTSASTRSFLAATDRKLLAMSIVNGETRVLATDVNHLFDVTADGRYALVETSPKPTPGSREGDGTNPISLTVIDLESGKRTGTLPLPVPAKQSVRIEEAKFL